MLDIVHKMFIRKIDIPYGHKRQNKLRVLKET